MKTIENKNKSKRDFQERCLGIFMHQLWIFCRSLLPATQIHRCICLPNLKMLNKILTRLISLSESTVIAKLRNAIWIYKNLKKKWMFRNKIKHRKPDLNISLNFQTFTLIMRLMTGEIDKDPNRNKKKWHSNLKMILIIDQNHQYLISVIMTIFREKIIQPILFQLLLNCTISLNIKN